MFSSIPLPQAQSPGESLNNFRAQTNALSKQQMENRQLQAQGNLTQTQANWTPYQYATQALANPTLWSTPGGIEAGKNIIASLPELIKRGQSGSSLDSKGLMQIALEKMGHGAEKLLGNVFAKNNDQEQQHQGGNPLSQISGTTQQPIVNGQQSASSIADSPGAGVPNPQGTTGNIPSTQINRLGQNQPLAGVNPLSISEAQTGALKTSATGEAQSQEDQWNAKQIKASHDSDSAVNNDALLDEMVENRKKLNFLEKGPGLGSLPAVSDAASNLDKAQNALSNGVAMAQVDGKITGIDREAFNRIKPSRNQPDKAFYDQINFNRGMNKRAQEYQPFLQKAREYNLNPTQADALWAYYRRERPFYDAKTGNINDGSKGTKDNIGSWEDFFTPQKYKEALSPSAQKAYKKEQEEADKLREKMESKVSEEPKGNEETKNTKVEVNQKSNPSKFSDEDLQFTAKQYHMTVDEVRKFLEGKNAS